MVPHPDGSTPTLVPALTEVGPEDVPALAAGAAIFGTGGGGAVHNASRIVERTLRDFGPVQLIGVEELSEDDAVIMMSGVGAPTVGIEMLSSTAQPETLLREAQRTLGRKITAIMPAEIGGSNGVSPLGWAARLGVKVLDADGMGRAFPEATMISPNVAGVRCEFSVQADVVGNVEVRRPIDLKWLERHARAGVVASGGIVMAAHYPLSADTAPGAVIPRTISRAVSVGQALLTASSPVSAVADVLGADTLITGKIVDVARRTEGGFVRGSLTIAGTGSDRGRLQRIELQNENLVALEDGEVLASVPDLISILDAETGHAISTEMIRFGQRVAVIAWACDPLWRTDRGLELAGPRAFGYDLPYVPFERKSTR
ncbi:DUF917 domain-containing protein [Microbacterium horticulturae]|uniref:DUF917 domain-containing protein n=1 Tax=Microbacterium horticulturae TaxID=3028316 RepID=A0ABY8C030_9MICO|nr:DUF917 domain-containing protein [Microbacterium sp. KACC 23027]WEG08692.1 DUF917 domain-containing protein [Microbacterium sp. KACC 23027]